MGTITAAIEVPPTGDEVELNIEYDAWNFPQTWEEPADDHCEITDYAVIGVLPEGITEEDVTTQFEVEKERLTQLCWEDFLNKKAESRCRARANRLGWEY